MGWLLIIGIVVVLICVVFLVKRQRKVFVYGLVAGVLMILVSGISLVVSGVSSLTGKVKEGIQEIEARSEQWKEEFPKEEERLYKKLFNQAPGTCVSFVNSERVSGVTTDFYWANIRTCPDEVRAIASKNSYEKETVVTPHLRVAGVPHLSWFTPQRLGDRIQLWTFRNDAEQSYHELFLSNDSTQMYLIYQRLSVDLD